MASRAADNPQLGLPISTWLIRAPGKQVSSNVMMAFFCMGVTITGVFSELNPLYFNLLFENVSVVNGSCVWF